jgi:hypothetical protein
MGLSAQNYGTIRVRETAVETPGWHTFSIGHHESDWLILGGRVDGMHGVQPSQAYTAQDRNQVLTVLDPVSGQQWSAPMPTDWPLELQDFLMSASQQFYQSEDNLLIIGGYGFSYATNSKITHPYAAMIDVPATIEAIKNGMALPMPVWKTDQMFAVCGGRLLSLDNEYYLVGGHRFDGAYNNLNLPTYTQTYTNQVRRFSLQSADNQFVITDYDTLMTDPVHLRRRDYNLVPQVDVNGQNGMTIFSGVFQPDHNLPYLYPVHINGSGYEPMTSLTQTFNHYHCVTIPMSNAADNTMTTWFLGGLSRYYTGLNGLVDDTLIAFVPTVGAMRRDAANQWTEWAQTENLPKRMGSGAEWLINPALPLDLYGQIIRADLLPEADSILLGWMLGGLDADYENPFSNNDIYSTRALKKLYEIWFIAQDSTNAVQSPAQTSPLTCTVNTDSETTVKIRTTSPETGNLYWYIQDSQGKIMHKGQIQATIGTQNMILPTELSKGWYRLTVHLDGKYWTATSFVR